MKTINVIALLLATAAAVIVDDNETAQMLAQAGSQASTKMEDEDTEEQMSVFKQNQ